MKRVWRVIYADPGFVDEDSTDTDATVFRVSADNVADALTVADAAFREWCAAGGGDADTMTVVEAKMICEVDR